MSYCGFQTLQRIDIWGKIFFLSAVNVASHSIYNFIFFKSNEKVHVIPTVRSYYHRVPTIEQE